MEKTAAELKLEGMIKELFPGLAAEIQAKMEAQNSEISALKAQGVEQKNFIEALQAEKSRRVELKVPGTNMTVPAMYKGRRLDTMGAVMGLAPEYKDQVAKMFIDMIEMRFKHNHSAVEVAKDYMTKDLSEGTADAVGYLVFPEFIASLLAFARQRSTALQDCRIINVSTDQIYIPMESTSVNVVWLNEAGTLTQSEPVVGQLALTPKKLGAFSVLSNEVLADSVFDLPSWLTELFAEAIAVELDSQIFNGSAFTGVIGATTNEVDVTGTITIAKLAELVNYIPAYKATGAKLYMHRNGFTKLLTVEDGAGFNLFPPTMGKPVSLWGTVPIVLNEQFPSAVTDGDFIGLYGNLNNYIIAARKTGISLEMDPYGLFTKDQTRFRVTVRYHGAPWNTSAFCKLEY